MFVSELSQTEIYCRRSQNFKWLKSVKCLLIFIHKCSKIFCNFIFMSVTSLILKVCNIWFASFTSGTSVINLTTSSKVLIRKSAAGKPIYLPGRLCYQFWAIQSKLNNVLMYISMINCICLVRITAVLMISLFLFCTSLSISSM